MKDVDRYIAAEDAISIRASIGSLRSYLQKHTQTPVIEEAVRLVESQLDGISFELLLNHEYLVDVVRRWEKESFFRKRHGKGLAVEKAAPFVSFYVNCTTHTEKRTIKRERVPFKDQVTEKNPGFVNIEPLNARFPITPFIGGNQSWFRTGSEDRIQCVHCDGDKKIDCPECDGNREVRVRCPSCGGHRFKDVFRPSVFLASKGIYGGSGTFHQEHCTRCDNGTIIKTCRNCFGKGKVRCPSCDGCGEQYYREYIESKPSITKTEGITDTQVSKDWVCELLSSEKIVIQDFLPGDKLPTDARECVVHLQKIEIVIHPAALVSLLDKDNIRGGVVVARDTALCRTPQFWVDPVKKYGVLGVAALCLLMLVALVALGIKNVDFGVSETTKERLVESFSNSIPVSQPKKQVKKKKPKRKRSVEKKEKAPAAYNPFETLKPIGDDSNKDMLDLDRYLKGDAGIRNVN